MIKFHRDMVLYAPSSSSPPLLYVRLNAFNRLLACPRGSFRDRQIRDTYHPIFIDVGTEYPRLHILYTDALKECELQKANGDLYAAEAYEILRHAFHQFHNPEEAV